MNWKERLTELKVGDRVRIIKPGCDSPDTNCCKQNGYFDNIGTIVGLIGAMKDTGKFDVEINETNHCHFPKECLEKVI